MSLSCPNCGFQNPDNETLCQGCGLVLPPMLSAPRAEMTRPEISTQSLSMPALKPGPALGAPPADLERDPSQKRPAQNTHSELKKVPKNGTDAFAMPAPREAPEISIDAPCLRIGYDAENDLVIPRPMVSGFHARIALVEKRYVLEDLGSTNGTTVNGHRVSRAWVNPGDEIGLGSYKFTLNQDVTQRLLPDNDHRPTQAIAVSGGLIRPITIGREPDCDIILDAPQISRHHVRITWAGNGWRVEDLDSANGVAVNDRTNLVKSALVQDDDVLFLGSYRFPVNRIRDFMDPNLSSSDAGQMPLPTDKDVITIGRGQDNDIVIDAPQISRHHARLIRAHGELWLEDLDSANGTFVDGKKIKRAKIDPENTVSFGSYAVRLDMARGAIQRSYKGDILLQAENVRVEFKSGKSVARILDGISFTVYPTEFMGLLGPSGSGKTTLLMSLIGYLKPTYGRTLINGDDLSLNYDRFRGAIGYVPQDDIIHHQLTVYEALYYTAKLRLPPDTSDEEIERRIMQVLMDLEIEQTRNLRIGTPEQKGISGGQRKRVNLALELLTEPSLLCLDEPTSGLASEDALNVLRLLRKLADGGRTILLTVHQPSPQAYRLLDNVLYLAEGEQVYYGPAFPDSLFYFNPEVRPGTPEAETILGDPGNCMRPIVEASRAGEPMETFAARFRQSRYHAEYVEDRKKNRAGVAVTGSGTRKKPKFSVRQWFTLCRRYLAVKVKDRLGMFILLVQAPIIAILLNMVFVAEVEGVMSRLQFTPYALFLLVISAIWFGCSNAAREIVGEQAIYRRERMVNLSVLAYVLSKFTVLGLLCLFQCATLLLLTYFALDFWGNPIYHLGLLWCAAMVGVGMGLFLSAIVRTTEAAMALVPLLLIPQVILGGAIMPVAEMNLATKVLAHSTVSRWAFEGFLQTEHLSDAYEMSASDYPKPIAPGLPAPPPPPNPIDRFFGDTETRLRIDFAVLAGLALLTLFGVVLVLKIRER
ncbi:FHA domain-containing protein [Microvenator marinus]|uniref:FHA domain-containing protein n=1 Tax=Microvenator marinus TaxID=2600177 RepID=A0A5B8XSP7_9DELT|nr:FHA domain-containing protein [Microvenator marinus]QED27888.1 FHA domain-containing protein [Microvenator marinus]